MVPLLVIVPPVKPVPAVMLLTVPPAPVVASVAHAHAVQFHFITCPVPHVDGNSASPRRAMNAAICSRVTSAFGQYSVAVHPCVTPRFLIHATLTQNGLDVSTSVKPAHGAARAAGA